MNFLSVVGADGGDSVATDAVVQKAWAVTVDEIVFMVARIRPPLSTGPQLTRGRGGSADFFQFSWAGRMQLRFILMTILRQTTPDTV